MLDHQPVGRQEQPLSSQEPGSDTSQFPTIKGPGQSSRNISRLERRASRIREEVKFNDGEPVSQLFSKVLAGRGYDVDKRPQQLEQLLNASLEKDLPPINELKNINKAAELLATAIKSGKRVALCCDYDVDGTTSAAIMYHFIKDMGGDVEIFVPDRFDEGYGLKKGLVDRLKPENFDLLVTLDFGTKNMEELKYAKERAKAAGRHLDTVVIDHHHAPEGSIKPADAFVNPKQRGCGYAGKVLCTAGLAYVYAQAATQALIDGPNKRWSERAKRYDTAPLLGFASLGTVADVVPLVGANRAICQEGFKQVMETKFPGLEALRQIADVRGDIRSEDISFLIGPMINAAGRLETAELAIELLTMRAVPKAMQEDAQQEAEESAMRLQELNDRRKTLDRLGAMRAWDIAEEQIREAGRMPDAFVINDELFHEGVSGIIASRMAERTHRPVWIFARGKDGKWKGSARVPRDLEGPHLAIALEDEAIQALITGGGGHAKAAGSSTWHIPEFRQEMLRALGEQMKGVDTTPIVPVDAWVDIKDIKESGLRYFDELVMLEPVGEKNRVPALGVNNAQIVKIWDIGESGYKKLKLRQTIDGEDHYLTAMWFKRVDNPAMEVGKSVNVAGTLSINEHIRRPKDPERVMMILDAVEGA